MKKIILIGAGGHCKSCIDVIESEKKYKIFGIVEKNKTKKSLLGYKIFGENYLNKKLRKNFYVIITVGHIKDYLIRVKIFRKLKKLGFRFATIVSPLAHISKYSILGEGTIVMHGAIINADAKIGKNCIINSKALVEHDVIIGDHCHISTAAVINGSVLIKSKTFIGSGSTIVNNVVIKENSFVKSNSFIKK